MCGWDNAASSSLRRTVFLCDGRVVDPGGNVACPQHSGLVWREEQVAVCVGQIILLVYSQAAGRLDMFVAVLVCGPISIVNRVTVSRLVSDCC